MYITVEEPLMRTLKDEYVFYVRTERGFIELVFSSYARYMRPTPRHRNWNRVAYWTAKTNKRDNTLKERPEVHQHTIDQALKQLTEAITVVLDWA